MESKLAVGGVVMTRRGHRSSLVKASSVESNINNAPKLNRASNCVPLLDMRRVMPDEARTTTVATECTKDDVRTSMDAHEMPTIVASSSDTCLSDSGYFTASRSGVDLVYPLNKDKKSPRGIARKCLSKIVNLGSRRRRSVDILLSAEDDHGVDSVPTTRRQSSLHVESISRAQDADGQGRGTKMSPRGLWARTPWGRNRSNVHSASSSPATSSPASSYNNSPRSLPPSSTGSPGSSAEQIPDLTDIPASTSLRDLRQLTRTPGVVIPGAPLTRSLLREACIQHHYSSTLGDHSSDTESYSDADIDTGSEIDSDDTKNDSRDGFYSAISRAIPSDEYAREDSGTDDEADHCIESDDEADNGTDSAVEDGESDNDLDHLLEQPMTLADAQRLGIVSAKVTVDAEGYHTLSDEPGTPPVSPASLAVSTDGHVARRHNKELRLSGCHIQCSRNRTMSMTDLTRSCDGNTPIMRGRSDSRADRARAKIGFSEPASPYMTSSPVITRMTRTCGAPIPSAPFTMALNDILGQEVSAVFTPDNESTANVPNA